MASIRIAALLPLIALIFPAAVSGDTPAGSCYVSVVALRDPPLKDYPDGGVSVRIFNGASRLFETPVKPLSEPGFTNRIRFYSAKSMPVRFVVMVWPGSRPVETKPESAPHREARSVDVDSSGGEDVLGIGFEGLIGDYDPVVPAPQTADTRKPEPSKPATPAGRGKPKPGSTAFVLCEAAIEWPPVDGVHSLACGGSKLEIRTEMIVRSAR